MTIVQRHLIFSEDEAHRTVELFLARPRSEPPKGAVLFVHGFQGGMWIGGREFAENGTLAGICDRLNVMAASVSQPGFGASGGPPDFCGPSSQEAVHAALSFLRRQPGAAATPIALYGLSRGAVVAAMVASQNADLSALILVSGNYDLAATYRMAPPGICRAIEREAGVSDGDFAARSPLYHAQRIRSETLLLHGRFDDRAPFDQAEQMAEALTGAGTAGSLEAFECDHRIPRGLSRGAILPFLERMLRPTLH